VAAPSQQFELSDTWCKRGKKTLIETGMQSIRAKETSLIYPFHRLVDLTASGNVLEIKKN